MTASLEPREKLAQLQKNQRSLYTLWSEFEFGVRSDKPANDYNLRDRGANRYLYSKQKRFWDLVVMMMNRGREANDAIVSIYKHFGYKTPVLYIIKQLQKERMNGTGYPSSYSGYFITCRRFLLVCRNLAFTSCHFF